MRKYKSKNYHCLYVPKFDNNILMEKLPDAWNCPVCGTNKKNFLPIRGENDTGFSVEKKQQHIPVITKNETSISVKVDHPMDKDHFIKSIAVYKFERLVEEKKLSYSDKPDVLFENIDYNDKHTVLAICNIHGIWEAN